MGLLDIFDSEQGRLGLGLLAMAGPQARPMGFGERLMGAYGMVDQMRQQKKAQELDEIKKDLYRAQIGETNAQAEERKANAQKNAEALAREQQFRQSLLPQRAAAAPGQIGSGSFGVVDTGGMPDMPAVKPTDWDALARAFPDRLDQIQKLAQASNFGRTKVARTIKGMGPDGKEYEYQVDEFGQRVGDGLAQYKAPLQVNQGDRTTFVDQYTLAPKASMPMNMSPSERDASARGWASNRLAEQRFNWEQNKDAKPSFNADAGGFIIPPSTTNPNGAIIPLQGFSKPPTDAQGKSVLFGSRMAQSNAILNDLERNGVTPAWSLAAAESVPLIGGAVRAAVNAGPLVSKDEQKYDQAQRDFVNAVLRRESGAVISPEEFANAAKQYFPQPGDSDEVKAQKRRNRETALEGIKYEAGPHSSAIKSPPEKVTASTKASDLKVGKVYELPNGKTAKWNGMNFVGE